MTTTADGSGIDALIEMLGGALDLGDCGAITRRIADRMSAMVRDGSLSLPARFHQPRPDCYARRLLHRDPAGRYSVVVMTWGPDQGTPLHDHSGMWCVEAVAHGEMQVVQYDMLEERDGICRFELRGETQAGVGSSGCLIPPFEYHVLRNSRRDEPSITIHVYGGEMSHCCAFIPLDDGRYRRQQRTLAFHD